MINQNDIAESWSSCFKVWLQAGRVEDLPRNIRTPSYTPTEGKHLGSQFAKTFLAEYHFVIAKLKSSNPIEVLCAFEVLEFMCWEFYYNNVPEDILNISAPLPPPINEEVHSDAELELNGEKFPGKTIGDLFKAKFIEPEFPST